MTVSAAIPVIPKSAKTVRISRNVGLFGVVVAIFMMARLIYQLMQTEYGSTPLDEILVVCVGLAAPFGVRSLLREGSGRRFLLCVAAYVVVILASSYMHPYSFERGKLVFYMGLALDTKFFVLFFGAYALALNSVVKGTSKRGIRLILYTLVFVACVDSVQVIQDAFGNGVGYAGMLLDMRGPFYRPAGFFHHAVLSAQVSLYGFLAALALVASRFNPFRLAIAVYLFLMVIIHVSVKEIIIACLGLMMFLLLFVRSDLLTKTIAAFVGIAAVGSVFASTAGDQITQRISYYTGEEGADSVRRVLYSASVDVANDMAPLGAGTSTFGSQGSRTNGYSSLYFTYGVYGRWGASKENDNFLLDTFWPKILAEAGYLGVIFFLGTVAILMGASFRLMMTTRSPEDAFLFAANGGVLIISVATAALGEEYVGSMFYLFGAMALARASILISPTKRRRKPKRRRTERLAAGRPAYLRRSDPGRGRASIRRGITTQ